MIEVMRCRFSGSAGQYLRRKSRLCLAESKHVAVRSSCSTSPAVPTAPSESVDVSPAVLAKNDAEEMLAPAPAGGASVANRRKPVNGYLNKVSKEPVDKLWRLGAA